MLDWNCREKRSQALQRCNLARDISVDGTPMVLPVPGEHPFVGDSFLEDHWIPEPCLKKPSARLRAHHLSLSLISSSEAEGSLVVCIAVSFL